MFLLRASKYIAFLTAALGALVLLAPRSAQLGAVSIDLQRTNAVLLVFVSALVVVVANYSQRNLLGQEHLERFGALLIAAFAGLVVMVTAGNLAQFALGWTVSGQATALLVGHAGGPNARRASAYVRSWLLVSDVLVWLAVLSAALPNSPQIHIGALDFTGSVAGIFLVLACIARTGLVPAHRWLAQTAEAPSPVSAFLHAGIINAAGIAVVLWLPIMRPWLPVLLVSACLTVVVGLWTIKARTDVKGKLASSTSTQMAFMSIEAAVGLPGLALLHLIGHGSYKSWCFLRAGGAITRNRLGHRPSVRSLRLMLLAIGVSLASAAATMWILGTVEVLSATVGVAAAITVIALAAGAGKRQVGIITVISALGLVGYLVLVHSWLGWLPLPVWQDTPLLIIALSSLAVGVVAPLLFKGNVLQRIAWYLIAPRWMRTQGTDASNLPKSKNDPYATEMVRLHELVDTAASSVAPTWPLRTAVAINPVQSLTSMSFAEAASTAASWGSSLYPAPQHYLRLLDSGDITLANLEAAAGGPTAATYLIEQTQALAARPTASGDSPSALWETAHRWCQLAWSDSQSEGDCFTQWHQALPRRLAQRISPIPILALHQALCAHLDQTGMQLLDDQDSTGSELRLLNALLTQAPGWAAHAHWRGHDALVQLLALRACLTALESDDTTSTPAHSFPGAEIWQQALECTFDQWLSPQIEADNSASNPGARIGVVTCIDVRSEPMRRALERSGRVRTFGAAGFFGIDASLHINDTTIDLAPVILKPSVAVQASSRPSTISELARGIDSTMGGIGGLAIAEAYGLFALVASFLNTSWPSLATRLARFKNVDPWLGSTGLDAGELSVERQVQYARAFLDALGTQDLPDLIAVAGHGADAANNAFAAAYQCGACGGNSGAINARLIVACLNNPDVRQQLVADGYLVQHTLIVAAMHNTTSNTLTIDPATDIPASHETLVRDLNGSATQAHKWLEQSDQGLPGRDHPTRGLDWAQPFPEWGLVGNAACIIGPRELSAGKNLQGRVFLHEYDWTLDPNGALLSNILQGPGVVMHMINMQYFCSTSDQRSFGSLDKTRHNAVGDTGVLVGASGDLHYGLPWQSLGPAPDQPRHVPVRLRIHVAAPREHLDAALAGTAIEQLAANGWLSITPITTSTTSAPVEAT